MKYSLVISLIILHSVVSAQFVQYASVDNLIAPRIALTPDNHIIFLAEEREYEANASPIFGGDPYAHFLVKTDLQGNVIWSNKYLSEWKSYPYKLFPQEDGTLMSIGKVANTFECLGINDPFGIPQIELLYFNADGSFNRRVQFPENCQQQYRDVVKREDHFVLLSWYKHIVTNENEAYLSLIHNDGYVIEEVVLEDEPFFRAKMILNDDGTLSVYYAENETKIYHSLFDEHLQKVKDELILDLGTFSSYGSQLEVIHAKNGDHIIYSSFYQDGIRQVNFLRISDGDIVAQERHLGVYARHMVELTDESFVLAYTDYDVDTTWTMGLLYLDQEGKKIKDSLVIHEGHQRPSKMIATENNEFVITGDYNCCNRDTLIGSANAFLWFNEGTHTNALNAQLEAAYHIYPNPSEDFIFIKGRDLNLKSRCMVYDVFGRQVLAVPLYNHENRINISNLPAGYYRLQISENNRLVHSSSMIKH